MVKIVKTVENKIKYFSKILWAGPFLEGRAAKGKQTIYSTWPKPFIIGPSTYSRFVLTKMILVMIAPLERGGGGALTPEKYK